MPIRRPAPRSCDPNVAEIASLIGDRARAAMLFALLDGGELAATDLSFRAGVSAQSASAHLAKLTAAGLIRARSSGRQRLFTVASAEVAYAMEALAAIARPVPVAALMQSTTMERMREARSCYDHLAGRAGVALTDFFIKNNALVSVKGTFSLGAAGERRFSKLGIDLDATRKTRRGFVRACIDWTERRPHIAGSLGAALLALLISEGWLKRNPHDRALHVTPQGRLEFRRRFGIELTKR